MDCLHASKVVSLRGPQSLPKRYDPLRWRKYAAEKFQHTQRTPTLQEDVLVANARNTESEKRGDWAKARSRARDGVRSRAERGG